MWKGSKGLLLNEYFDDKIELQRLKYLPYCLVEDDTNYKIEKLEIKIKDFLSMLTMEELKSIILMSLDIEE